ncbi:Uncharacterised protein [Streptococcus pneumoniae]|nr:Uncharacterised protein [Streptococcus pneumoniae]
MDDFQIIWKDQQEDNSRQIEYIPQEYMFALARDNKKLKDFRIDKYLDRYIESYQ